MSINSKMTAIASKIRGLLGISEAMGMDAMAHNLDTVQSGVDSQAALLDYAIDVIQNKAAGSGSGGGTTGPFSVVEEFEWEAPSKFTPTSGELIIEHHLNAIPDGFILTALSAESGSETENVVTTVVLDNTMLYADAYPLGLACGTGKSLANISTSIWLDAGDCRTLNNIVIIFELSSKMVIPAGKRYRVMVYKRKG